MNTTLRKLLVLSLVGFGILCFLKGLPSNFTKDAADSVMPGAVASIHSDRTTLPDTTFKTQAIQDIKVGQRVVAKNPEISRLERRTRRAEPDFGRWLQLSLELPKPDGSTLHIEMLRSEEWLRNQIGFVIGEVSSGERQGVSPPSAIPSAIVTPDLNLPSPKTENLQPKTLADFCDSPLAPLSPLRPIFSDILFASLAAEADGAELVGLTVQLDLPELGLTGEAILTDIQTTPRIEAPLDSRDERQVVTATFHHSSGDVIDLVVVDSLGERQGVSPPSAVQETFPAESRQQNQEIAGRESEISDFKSPPSDFPKAENLKPKTSGEAETIGTTSNHPFWSEDRQEFVQAGSLEIGERLQTLSGDVKVVQQKLPRPGPQPVFNLEVHDEHVYFVGEDGVLVHNNRAYSSNRSTMAADEAVELGVLSVKSPSSRGGARSNQIGDDFKHALGERIRKNKNVANVAYEVRRNVTVNGQTFLRKIDIQVTHLDGRVFHIEAKAGGSGRNPVQELLDQEIFRQDGIRSTVVRQQRRR